jgi:hypothetical protein
VAPHAILRLGDPESAATALWPIPSARMPGVAKEAAMYWRRPACYRIRLSHAGGKVGQIRERPDCGLGSVLDPDLVSAVNYTNCW